jgi:hypothetical protein
MGVFTGQEAFKPQCNMDGLIIEIQEKAVGVVFWKQLDCKWGRGQIMGNAMQDNFWVHSSNGRL